MTSVLRRFHSLLGRNPATAILVSMSIGVIAAGIAAGTFFRGESTRRIVTTCLNDPSGRECQKAKRTSDREQNLRDACISPHKYLTDDAYRDETRCPRRGSHERTEEVRPSGDDRPAPGTTAVQPPAGGDGGTGDAGGDAPDVGPGHAPEPAPLPPDPAPAPQPPGPEPHGSDPAVDLTIPVCTALNALGVEIEVAC